MDSPQMLNSCPMGTQLGDMTATAVKVPKSWISSALWKIALMQYVPPSPLPGKLSQRSHNRMAHRSNENAQMIWVIK